jgi:hypothetical protein
MVYLKTIQVRRKQKKTDQKRKDIKRRRKKKFTHGQERGKDLLLAIKSRLSEKRISLRGKKRGTSKLESPRHKRFPSTRD